MYKELQNGSDIRGIAISSDRGERNLTPQAVRAIGMGFVKFLKEKLPECEGDKTSNLKIAIGHDSRMTGEELFMRIAEGILNEDETIDIIYTRLSTTPAMFMSTVLPGHCYDAGIMITASHLPYDRNGIKFFLREGGLEKEDISRILELASDTNPVQTAALKFECVDLMSDYAESLRRVIVDAAGLGEKPLSGLKIIVDAGNGAGGFFADKVLKPLGADTSGSLFLEPDGRFPNHTPNPEDASAMECISQAVVDNGADLGIIFDADVDRAALIFSDGRPVNRNRLIALMSAIVLRKHPGSAIVTDSITSDGLTSFIEKAGGIHRRFKRGYRNVINESKRLNACGTESWLAIETSGHGAMKENYFLDDGAYMACVLLAEAAKRKSAGERLEELISDLEEPAEAMELRINITTSPHGEYGQSVINSLKKEILTWDGYSVDENNCEGVRVNFSLENGSGWFLLRLSLHDPVLPLNIESDNPESCGVVLQRLNEFFSRYSGLELKSIH